VPWFWENGCEWALILDSCVSDRLQSRCDEDEEELYISTALKCSRLKEGNGLSRMSIRRELHFAQYKSSTPASLLVILLVNINVEIGRLRYLPTSKRFDRLTLFPPVFESLRAVSMLPSRIDP
jgi:hypothetical protein